MPKETAPMDITSPFFVVPLIVVIFAAAILFGTSSKEDGHENHHAH
jgi:hypothetical protein